jgi:Tol biopolymer transport system component
VRLALVIGAAVLAGSVAGAQARETAAFPPIVFASGQLDRDLVVMRQNGSHRRVLTPAGRDDSDPSWSPDGLRIAFSFYNGRRERIALLEVRSGQVQDLGDGFNPDWSPDGRRLVFLDAEGFDDLVIMNPNGSNRRRLGLTRTGIADETDPSWSPDGREIAFVGDGLWIADAATGKPRRIRPEGGPGGATWSPDGRTIAYDCVTRSFHVCLVRADGTGIRGLTRKGRHPSWSSRGNLIAVTRQDVLKPGILVFRPNGRLVQALRNGSASADWSPDGKRLVAEREIVGGPRLYATDASRGSLVRLTQGRYQDSAASWSPDGRSIVYRRQKGRTCSIAVLNTTNRKLRLLVRRTVDPGCFDQPTWSTDGRRVLYSSRGDLWQVPSRGGRARRLTRTPAAERSPRIAPDGRSIGFVSRGDAWLLHPNGERSLLVAGAIDFSWSHDGQTLAYLISASEVETDLYLRVGNGAPRKLLGSVENAPSWSPDDRRLALSFLTGGPSAETSVLAVTDLDGHVTDLLDDATQPDWRP